MGFFNRISIRFDFFRPICCPTAFNDKKSLAENFSAMCSLPFPKTRSKATNELVAILKQCPLIPNPTSHRERLKNYAVLELASLAIAKWLRERDRVSTRVNLVNEFKLAIITNQKKITAHPDYKLFSLQQFTPETHHQNVLRQLNPTQQHLFKQLMADTPAKTLTSAPLIQSRLHRFACAIFMPFINLAMDWDCFDCMLDGFNVMFDLTKAGVF